MCATETSRVKKQEKLINWRKQPIEIKIMDLAILGWLAIFIIDIVFAIFQDLNVRSLASVFLTIFMFFITLALRLKLVEKPEQVKSTFVIWLILFVLSVLSTIAVLIFYPPLLGV